MRTLLLALGLALAAPALAEPPRGASAPLAQSGAALEAAAATLRAERQAMRDLVQALKEESRAGHVDLTDQGKLAWQRGVAAFDRAEALGAAGDWRGAWTQADDARRSVIRGADEAFSTRAGNPVRQALRRYLDAVEPRLAATRELLRSKGRDDLLPRWWDARARLEEAKKSAAVERYTRAWGALVVSVGTLDRFILEVGFPSVETVTATELPQE